MRNSIKIILMLLAFIPSVTGAGLREEIHRYTLLHDRVIIDRNLRSYPYQEFIYTDFVISSGLKSLIGDISNGTEDSQSTIEKQLNMFELLSKYVNTEQFVDLDLGAGIPLPRIKIKKFKIRPSAFYHLNFGVMATISNQDSVTNPTAQTYVKKETKMGLNFNIQNRAKEHWRLAFYKMARADLSSSVTSASLATDGELFDFNKLKEDQETYAVDLAFEERFKYYSFLSEIREFKVMAANSTNSLYGNRPLVHLNTTRRFDTDKYQLSVFLGIHYRKWYSLMRGLYTGFNFRYLKADNLRFIFKMSNQFFVLNPLVEFKYFRFSYSYKSPFRNPQNDIWVQGMHNVSLAIPFS